MLSKKDFIEFILHGPKNGAPAASTPDEAALPDGFDGFDSGDEIGQPADTASSFARRLLEASGFGYAELVQRDNVIRSTDAVAGHLPDRASFWPKTASRSYQTLLFEADLDHKQLLAIPAFKGRKMSHLDIVEDALARLVSEALDGFQRGGEGVTADVRKGMKEETLCVVSIVDKREGQSVRLVCFGTQNKATGGLETFLITEQTRHWDPQLAREHLALLYERQFKKLESKTWQDAFTTTEERKQAEKLLKICTRKAPKEHDIQEGVLDLLDTIAKGFGLRKKAKTDRRLHAFALPADHDIGIDAEELEGSFGGTNPFGGVTLRDERNRLLGYIVYPLKTKTDAARLRKHLEKNNRFHNVLVVYPDADQASLELWQGDEQLTGKLRKGKSGYKDAAHVVNLLSRFFVVSKAKVKNPTELAEELAYRARYLRRLAVKQLADEPDEGPLRNLYDAFKEALVHDQTEDEFADAFAQTITYGLLTARWTGHDQLAAGGERFTRQTALKHLSAASPFLNDLFKSVLSIRLDEQRGRLLWLVDDVADLLDRIDVSFVFGGGDDNPDTATDPVIHFYEPFLEAYDKKLKNKRGVFFTPRPVVSFIVRGVHELLKSEFGLEDGLASTDTWGDVATRVDGMTIPDGVERSDPFVCILDPATGTGTFLFECIELIERTMKDKWRSEPDQPMGLEASIASRWTEYAQQHLVPRLYGYELMMASYSVAHLKLSFKLRETGYEPVSPGTRLNIYLTNSLEPAADVQPELEGTSPALARESRAVNAIKREKRFTVVMGNPPYSVTSFNSNTFIDGLMADYKKHVRGEQGLVALADDYLKFIRISQHTLRAAGAGVWGMITNHGFLKGVIHRGVRYELLEQFSRLFVLDLHGDSNVGEAAPPSMANENVFDIQQGVGITIGSHRTALDAEPAVSHSHCWGTRAEKYERLQVHRLQASDWEPLSPREPSFFLIPFDDTNLDEYQEFPSLVELMPVSSCGVKTHRDAFLIGYKKSDVEARFRDVATEPDLSILRDKYSVKDTRHWSLEDARRKIARDGVDGYVRRLTYRPFDDRWIYYNRDIIEKGDAKYPTLRHMLHDNLALVSARLQAAGACDAAFVSRYLVEMKTGESTRSCTVFPLYLADGHDAKKQQRSLSVDGMIAPNLAPAVLKQFAQALGIGIAGPHQLPQGIEPEQILQYCYAVLYSPGYRKRYGEFLRSAFPRIPLASKRSLFDELSRIGGQLVSLHLLETKDSTAISFEGASSPVVEKVSWSGETIWLNSKKTSGFVGVPRGVWEFRIGGYPVCDKWLKGRRKRSLSKAEIDRFIRVLAAIENTTRLMIAVDAAVEENGGWPGAFVSGAST